MWGIPYLDTETKSLVSNSGPVSDGFKSKHYKMLCKSWGRSYTGGAVVKVVLEQTSLEYRISIETEICLCTVGLLRWSNVFYVTLPVCLVDTICVSCFICNVALTGALSNQCSVVYEVRRTTCVVMCQHTMVTGFPTLVIFVIDCYIYSLYKGNDKVKTGTHFLHVYKPGSKCTF